MIKYGLISELDGKTLEKTIDLITQREFIGQEINITEIGIFDGQTARGLYEYVTTRHYGSASANPSDGVMKDNTYKCNYTAIDNEKDKLIKLPFPECKFIRGNSNEVYNQIPDESQHLIFIDGCHNFPSVVQDFFCYERKIKKGGYMAFHDTGDHIQPFKDYQGVGSKDDQDMYISVKKALERIGLMTEIFRTAPDGSKYFECKFYGWKLIFHEADITDPAGGITVFKKLY